MANLLRVYENDLVEVIGVDFETHSIQVIARNSKAIVIKVAGRTCWVGRGMPRKYLPPEFLVYKITGESTIEDSIEKIPVEPLIDWEHKR